MALISGLANTENSKKETMNKMAESIVSAISLSEYCLGGGNDAVSYRLTAGATKDIATSTYRIAFKFVSNLTHCYFTLCQK